MSGERFDSTTLIVQRLSALESKLDDNNTMTNEIRISVAQHAITLNAQHNSLDEHIRRTKNLEERVKPIESHVIRMDGALKLLGVLAVIAGIAASVVKIFAP